LQPLVDSHDYRRVLDELLPMRGVALGILLADLHEAFSQRRIVAARWCVASVHAVARLMCVLAGTRQMSTTC
jgi:hypothetical protein